MFVKTALISTFLVATVYTAGCATTGPSGQAEIDTWKGATIDELYQAYGTPSQPVARIDGNSRVEFEYSRLNSSTPYYCTVQYTVDPSGIVLGGTYEGNIGGCNHLIRAYPDTH